MNKWLMILISGPLNLINKASQLIKLMKILPILYVAIRLYVTIVYIDYI